MSNTELLAKLRGLHEQLASLNDNLDAVEQIDDQTIDALGDLVSDLSDVVDHAKSATDLQIDSPANHHPNHYLNDRIREFETHHPRVTEFLAQMTDMLAMLGI